MNFLEKIKGQSKFKVKTFRLAGDDNNKIALKIQNNLKLIEEQKKIESKLRESFERKEV